jgi:hypothetical protein
VRCRNFTATPPWRKTTPTDAIIVGTDVSRAGLSSEKPHTKIPSHGQHTIWIVSSNLVFAVVASWSTATAERTGRLTTAGDNRAPARWGQAHRRSAAAPSKASTTNKREPSSYRRGPRNPDRAQAAQIGPARVGGRKLAGPPASPGRRSTSLDPRRCSCPAAPLRGPRSSTSPGTRRSSASPRIEVEAGVRLLALRLRRPGAATTPVAGGGSG